MKSNGSTYVAVVFAVLIAYFGYQWWFNPSRAVKQRLGEVAAALSAPDEEADSARIVRIAQLRRYLADDLRIHVGDQEIKSRDAALGIAAAWRPPAGGGDVHFADVQIFIESDTTAHAYMAVELSRLDRQTGLAAVDSSDASVSLARLVLT